MGFASNHSPKKAKDVQVNRHSFALDLSFDVNLKTENNENLFDNKLLDKYLEPHNEADKEQEQWNNFFGQDQDLYENVLEEEVECQVDQVEQAEDKDDET